MLGRARAGRGGAAEGGGAEGGTGQAGGEHRRAVVMRVCGHAVHGRCLKVYLAKLAERHTELVQVGGGEGGREGGGVVGPWAGSCGRS